ncbi:MAG: metal-binding protein [Thermoplasmata archaeon]|nr:MAG: metal-binding protein [Thermoplasmata archaeon]RLF53256.1 MAG: metal-binding protein [Thermoplasmata archaeon]
MQKDELIQLHTFLLQLKTHLEEMVENNGGDEFNAYNRLNVTPYQVYKSKREHKLAVFTLSKGIATLLSRNNCPGLEKVSNRLDQMAERFMTEKEKELLHSLK